ncbi:hypothetical protein SS50377_23064 [Spironucleus salmonicida]|uniref:Uncharacterized protein n=1 Tax=Spironucleus salmonicida TaxID=348837 RepID=V6LSP7_9EUKA|nr:hypothetical protein SS50377_23064 [Spironucleus salmonicida]|eukprot:EST47640.1 Hypothetical protein SS50377_12335 [Spironucleus salmonicida]
MQPTNSYIKLTISLTQPHFIEPYNKQVNLYRCLCSDCPFKAILLNEDINMVVSPHSQSNQYQKAQDIIKKAIIKKYIRKYQIIPYLIQLDIGFQQIDLYKQAKLNYQEALENYQIFLEIDIENFQTGKNKKLVQIMRLEENQLIFVEIVPKYVTNEPDIFLPLSIQLDLNSDDIENIQQNYIDVANKLLASIIQFFPYELSLFGTMCETYKFENKNVISSYIAGILSVQEIVYERLTQVQGFSIQVASIQQQDINYNLKELYFNQITKRVYISESIEELREQETEETFESDESQKSSGFADSQDIDEC